MTELTAAYSRSIWTHAVSIIMSTCEIVDSKSWLFRKHGPFILISTLICNLKFHRKKRIINISFHVGESRWKNPNMETYERLICIITSQSYSIIYITEYLSKSIIIGNINNWRPTNPRKTSNLERMETHHVTLRNDIFYIIS